jgi:glycosyltransferase involved in cell wall biosynthesis
MVKLEIEPGWGDRDVGSLRARLRPLVRPAREFIATLKAAYLLRGSDAPRGAVRVFFGFPDLPDDNAVTVGGLVKVRALAQVFPNTRPGFNVLYLVSSSLPQGAVALARAAKRKKVRVVINQNGVAYPGWYGQGYESINAPMAELLEIADHVFYQSDFCRMAANEYLRVRPAASETLYNSVDTTTFSPGSMTPDAALTLLLAGSQDKSYRVKIALEVLAQVVRVRADARLIVTGRLGWTARHEHAGAMALEWARELGVADRVSFTGPYRQAAAAEIFRAAHILLHTKYNDPCPTVVLEAMACGLPVAYSATGGVPELVGANAGIGVPAEVRWDQEMPPDPAALADAVLTVAECYDQYSRAARQRAIDRFDIVPWLQRHTEVFQRLVA